MATHLIGEEPLRDAVGLADRLVDQAERIWAEPDTGWRTTWRRSGLLVQATEVTGPFAPAGVLVTRAVGDLRSDAPGVFSFLVSPQGFAVIDPLSDEADHHRPPLATFDWLPAARLECAVTGVRLPGVPQLEFVVLNAIDPARRVFASSSVLHPARPGGSVYSGEPAPPDVIRAINSFALAVQPLGAHRCRVLVMNYADPCGPAPAAMVNLINTKLFLPLMWRRLRAALATDAMPTNVDRA